MIDSCSIMLVEIKKIINNTKLTMINEDNVNISHIYYINVSYYKIYRVHSEIEDLAFCFIFPPFNENVLV